MDFQESEVAQSLRELTRKYAQSKILPHIEEDEKNEKFRPEIIAGLGELGLTGVTVSEDYGGAGLGYQEYITVIEEIAKASCAYAISVAVTGLPQIILQRFGNEEQKKKYIPALAAGKAIGAFSLSESSAGSDAASLRTTAVKKGDHYVLNGVKHWCTQADIAETIIVMARTGEAGPKGISAFVVPKGTPGMSMGKREKKMGCHISHTMEVLFNDAKVPAENILSLDGDGFKTAMTALNSGRITIAACALGVAQASLDIAVSHAKLREQFGKPIIDFQGVSFMLADMAVQLAAARLLVQKAAWLKDNDLPFSTEAAHAKLFATDMAMKVTTDAVQVLGGSGYTQDFPLERYMREAKVLQIVEGTNQIQRLVIGRSL